VRVDSREETSNTLQNAVCCSMLQVCCSEGGLEGRPSSLLIVLSLRTWETRVTRVLLSLRDMTLFTLVSHVRRDSTLGRETALMSLLSRRRVSLRETSDKSLATLVSVSAKVDRKKPPPLGGFPICYIPSSRTVCKRTPSKNLVQILQGGSSYTRFLMREHSK